MNIYFDMDGVLVDFEVATGDVKDLNHPTFELSDEKKAAKKQFWLNVEKNKNFWADIPLMKNIKDLLNAAKSKGKIFVLSKTPGAKHFVDGQKYVDFVANEKRKWILKYLGNFFDNEHIIICDGDKGKLIQPSKNDILIDDRLENITEWESCGGRGILFISVSDVVKKLENM